MLMFTRAIPWTLKACTVCAVTLRSYAGEGAAARHEHLFAAVSFVTLASVLPSLLRCVVDRPKTTAYVVQSLLFLVGVHATLLALQASGVRQYDVAVTQTCLLHMLWSQWHALERHPQVLIYRAAVQPLLALTAVAAWGACVLMLPHATVDMLALGGLMFVGEVLGVFVSVVAAILAGVGDTMEECLGS